MKKNLKTTLAALLLLTLASSLFSCTESQESKTTAASVTETTVTEHSPNTPVAVTGIEFSEKKLSMNVGERLFIEAKVLPLNASERAVLYSLSSGGVVSYENGYLEALAPGTVILTAKSAEGAFTATLEITVGEFVFPTETPATTETPTPSTPSTETPTPPFAQDTWLLRETEDAGLSYQNDLIFLGDSTTAGMIAYKVLPEGENTKQVWRGAVANTITFLYLQDVAILYPETGESLPILEAVKRSQPKYLVITLGVTGGVSLHLDKNDFLSLYKWLLDGIIKASPDTKIIVQSIFPVEKNRNTPAGDYTRITNEEIMQDNEWLKEMVEEYFIAGKNLRYSDVYGSLLNEEGFLDPKYGNGDGLHIGPDGYDVILHHLRTHAWM